MSLFAQCIAYSSQIQHLSAAAVLQSILLTLLLKLASGQSMKLNRCDCAVLLLLLLL